MYSFKRFLSNKSVLNSLKNKKKYSTTVGVIGVPFNKGQPKVGVEKAPDTLRELGLLTDLNELGVTVKDYGNIKFDEQVLDNSTDSFGILKFPKTVGRACEKVSCEVKKVLKENNICVTIGGDHSVSLGTVHGHSEVRDICVLWVDAHGDINTPLTTLSGFMHGLPCSLFLKELKKYQPNVAGFEWVTPRVSKQNMAYIGLRDLDPFEKLILDKEKIVYHTMADVDRLGIFEVLKCALKSINPKGNLALHVSFDIDAICKSEAPSTGTAVMGGLTSREAFCIGEEVSKLDYFRALDIMEINPMLGDKHQVEKTLQVAKILIKSFLGHYRSGSYPVNTDEIPVPTENSSLNNPDILKS